MSKYNLGKTTPPRPFPTELETDDYVTHDDKNAPREWNVAGAKKILDDYKKPLVDMDISDVYYAATQLEAAYEKALARIAELETKLIEALFSEIKEKPATITATEIIRRMNGENK